MSWMTVEKNSVLVAEKERKFQNKRIREIKSSLFQRSQLQKEVLCPEVWKGCSYKDWNPSLGQKIYTVLLVPGNLKRRKGAREEQVGMGKGGLYLGNTFEINYWEINGLGEIPGKSFGKKLDSIKRKIFPILRMENIKMQGTKTLYNATMDGLKMENLKKGINDLAGIDKLLVVITISLVINSLSLKRWFDCAKYNNLTNRI